ncbi:MAG TPA: 5-formaminoimidazole-4-carboxamide-1-(beta)-D-ribofuranosyl 5'-monophosphate synthetase [Candidatus Peribacter riflensis]|uniref:5-formaminoimidazole-4-carboxamide-1-(Beta)-D-ribofuranosyl 5'-monophosphate synthetase-like protein n=1 Tax=Candidatus Peribacter riflensis TaxID=1735162 RepID=A0A0S1SSD0_9BACT|nr:MAG: 5-formaminoimidazole-4-carboxamide-1-(beta)-D-ribofuranosyl 5'-monophosphate synthetase-like protein [Candidatus Peribacter riflensis]OGJ77779.1 MAG: 5-formaminoimidazole-4-carboxamide-1-(beta)-D-ribofuranosyl 5'-monophosphate synthetase [Candidatus Peribacteria bacterium RIFOXYB1_FULL_57_12]ALM11193.1 MAG: 5-formaminoimidazole-4-carboxamide-1-(beta)-D-ribofuranosyl 5'-monophosphate synthetase-like protein [Candidatus Peribacter riflensis]ALM12296.1 MAG: 5-formaminoimidazole-4-carboxamid
MNVPDLLKGYDTKNITIGVLGGHSALDVCHGAKKHGFKTVCVARKGREKTYDRYFRTKGKGRGTKGCIDEVILVDKFEDVLRKDVQEKLRSMNTIFVHNRYFWVYFSDYAAIENDFQIPIFGSRTFVKLEERDQPYNQYHLLHDAGIRTPKIFAKPEDIDRPVLVKAAEAQRGYERAFFVVGNQSSWEAEGSRLEQEGKVSAKWRQAPIEEFIVGAPVNFNFFWSPLTKELELLGTDTRRQTNLDGFLRMTAPEQTKALASGIPLKMIETGHIACTVKESILEKAFDLGEKFVTATQKLPKTLDPSGKGIIGPFALQGAVTAEDGKEDIVIFDVSLRIPGSPGTFATPYSRYLYGEAMSVGERVGMEIRKAVTEQAVEQVVT